MRNLTKILDPKKKKSQLISDEDRISIEMGAIRKNFQYLVNES